MKMPFGKYKGCELSWLPDHYLVWLYKWDNLRSPLKEAVLDEIQRRARSDADDEYGLNQATDNVVPAIRIQPGMIGLASIVFEFGYKAAALKVHPDVGGSQRLMTELNLLAESMRAQFKALLEN